MRTTPDLPRQDHSARPCGTRQVQANGGANAEGRKFAGRLVTQGYRDPLPEIQITANREFLFTFLEDLTDREYDNGAYDFEACTEQASHLIHENDYEHLK